MEPPKRTAAQEAAAQELRKVLHAYRTVFGTEGNRTGSQLLVWNDMKARARIEAPIFVKDANGVFDPLRAAISEGWRLSFLQIDEILKKDPDEKPAPAPVIK